MEARMVRRTGDGSGVIGRLGVVVVCVLVGVFGSTAIAASLPAAGPVASAGEDRAARPWLDTDRTIDQRIADLLDAMTLDEKVGQITQIENLSVSPDAAAGLLLGSVLSGGGGNPAGQNTAPAWYAMVEAYQRAALGTRLGIPLLYGVDMVHGAAHMTGATIFPHNIGLGATGDAALVTQVCRATAVESSAAGVRWTFGPVVAVPQDVRWGRTYEAFGEEPDLVSRLGAACIRGLQGNDLTNQGSIAATAKHFLGDGGTAYGSSTASAMGRPYLLDQGVDVLDDATIASLFLPPYAAAVDAGVRVVMTSFSSTREGGKVTGDHHWITDVLKDQLSFSGMVVSDWGAVDQIDPNDYEASVTAAMDAGVDMVMVPYDAERFGSALRASVAAGDVPMSRIDDAVSRILRVKLEMGLFEHPMPLPGLWDQVGSAADRALARTAVSRSAVLLKTRPGALPIAPDASVLLAGPGADDVGISSGGWTLSWQGQAGDVTAGTTLRAAMESVLGASVRFDRTGAFADGTHADVGVVVVAERPYAEGVGDSADLALPAADLAVIERVRPLVDTLVVVILSGRPVIVSGITDRADAVVAAWLPGTEDEGIADLLLGTEPFTGTSPYTWPLNAEDAPRVGKTACEGAVYPVGYGLDATGRLLGPEPC
jgi:beta-glucosidase